MRGFTFFLLTLALGLPTIAHAAAVNIHVTSSADSGPGSLRQAIIDGNALGASYYPNILIDLDSSQVINLSSTLPQMTSSIVYISGTTTSSRAVVDGQNLYPILRASSNTALFRLVNVTLQNAYSTSYGACLSLPATAGAAEVSNSWFEHCVAQGTYAGGGAIDASLAMNVHDSTFYDNAVRGSAIVNGGAIRLYSANTSAGLTISRCAFSTNLASTSSSQLGQPAEGGAIYAQAGDVTITDSLFDGNQALAANAVGAAHGGAVAMFNASLDAIRNSFNANWADAGGALYVSTTNPTSNTATLVNNTFTFNLAQNGVGGGLKSFGDVTLRNNTFAHNSADQVGSSIAGSYYATNPAPVVDAAWNNLVDGGMLNHDWCSGFAGATSAGYNIMPDSLCGFGNGTGSQVRTDLHLIGLGSTGSFNGATQQFERFPVVFLADGPALDAGNPAATSDTTTSACPTTDGFGNPRPADGNADGTQRCDIGAYEWQHEAPLFFDDFEDRSPR